MSYEEENKKLKRANEELESFLEFRQQQIDDYAHMVEALKSVNMVLSEENTRLRKISLFDIEIWLGQVTPETLEHLKRVIEKRLEVLMEEKE